MNKTIRLAYSSASESYSKLKEFESLLEAYDDQENSTLWAYQACTLALKAKNNWFPIQRLMYLSDSRNLFEKSVNKDPDNIENRFLRFSIQLNLPFFLGMSTDLDEDKEAIITYIISSKVEKEFKLVIANYLIDSKNCHTEEINQLRQFIDS